jgi:molecular chaperone DnaJ
VIQTPERLSNEAKELLRKFDELTGDSLNKDKDVKGERVKKKGIFDKVKNAFDE